VEASPAGQQRVHDWRNVFQVLHHKFVLFKRQFRQ
jgi:hypothetical protein